MPLQRAQFELRAFLLPVILSPHGERRAFRVFHAQLGDTAHNLEQAARYAANRADHPPMGCNLAQPDSDGDQQRNQAEDQGDDPESGIVEKDDGKNRQQKYERKYAVGDDALHAIAKILKRHSRHGQVAGRVAVQNA